MNAFADYINITQGIGFIAFILGIIGFSQQDDRKLKILMTAQSYTLCAHFFLLGANGAVVATFVSGTRNLASLFSRLKKIAPLFIALYVVLGYYTYEQWTDLLPLGASIVATIGYFYMSKINLRLCALFATSTWIIHNYIVGSIGPLFMEIFMLIANLRTIYLLYRLSKDQTVQTSEE